MASSLQTPAAPRSSRALLPPTLTLAGQRTRKTWGLLLLTELGMLGAVLLACVVPLYTNVTMAAALRGILNAQDSSIAVKTSPQLISTPVIARTTQVLDKEVGHVLGSSLKAVQFSIQAQALQLLTPGAHGALQESGADLNLISEDFSQASTHVRHIAGNLPDANASTLEIAVTPATAQALHASLGDILHVHVAFTDASGTIYVQSMDLRISELFLPSTSDFYWHGNTFTPSLAQGTHYYALLSNQALLNAFARLSSTAAPQLHFFASTPTVTWNYQLDASRMTINDLNPLFYGIQQIQFDNANNPKLEQDPYLEQTQTVFSIPETLNGLVGRISIIEFPVISLVVLILSLLLFFLVMMINLLIERQNEAIALLRGRGASRGQILAALTLQGITLAVIALLAGILLAPWVVRLLTWQMFGGHDQGALNIVAGNPLQTAQLVGPYALLTCAVTLITIVGAVWLAARRDIVSLRRETARSLHRPLWQRLRLDIIAALIALAGYGASLYLLNSNTLDSQLYLLMLAPLALLQTLFLLLAVLLILLRFYPNILRLGTRLVEGRRGAAPVLALAQIARAPRQPARMTLLLALASAFAIFALVFSATQAQRVQDVAAYQAGADFSGTIPTSSYTASDVSRATALYNHIPGVLGASLGLTLPAQAGASLNLPINLQSVDAATFAQAAGWSPQASTQSLTSLMRLLYSQRDKAIGQGSIPALVDTNAWNTLHLTPNAIFTLQVPQLGSDHILTFKAMAQVQHIPTSGNSATPEVLVDYPTLANVYASQTSNTLNALAIAPNYVWLRTRSDVSALTSVRGALTSGKLRLTSFYDRRAIATALYTDPIYLTLLGELELGAITTLFLALIGCLVASWLSVRSRLLNFVALRALGATVRQVTSTLAWEQGIIYTAALMLGILTGSVLAALSLPSLVLTSVLPNQATSNVSNANFYAAQFVPPLQVIIPTSLWLILGMLILLCLLALGLMLSKVTHSSIGMILRLSED